MIIKKLFIFFVKNKNQLHSTALATSILICLTACQNNKPNEPNTTSSSQQQQQQPQIHNATTTAQQHEQQTHAKINQVRDSIINARKNGWVKPPSTTVKIVKTEGDYAITETGKKLPAAEKSITPISETGWRKEDMDFHQKYCEQMMQSIETIKAKEFCTCFLSKIQYYYEPVYFNEAYKDQQKWNAECFKNASK